MKKGKIFNFTFYVIVFLSLAIAGCESSHVNTSATCRLDTSAYTLKHFYCQYEYLYWYQHESKIFEDSTYEEMKTAYDLARVTLLVNMQNPEKLYAAFITEDYATWEKFYQDAFDYAFSHQIQNNQYPDGYIYGLDSAHNILTGIPYRTLGIYVYLGTNKYSLVFVDKILNPVWYNGNYEAVKAVATHELGHQNGIFGHNEECGGNCVVVDCIMDSILISSMYNDIHFCSNHMWTVWNNAKPSQYLSGLSASAKLSKSPMRSSKNDNFTFTISMANNVFLECQPIRVILKIKNLSMAKDSIGDIFVDRDIMLKDVMSGEKINPNFAAEYFGVPYLYFEPGEEKTLDFEIKQAFSSVPLVNGTNKYGAKYYDCLYIPTGKYSVFIGKWGIISNQLYFEVVKPEGQDLSELNEVGNALIKSDERYRIDNLYDFLIKYPDSKYYELALFNYTATMLKNAYMLNDWLNLIAVADKWFEKDTESEFAKGLIRSLGSVSKTSFKEAKKKIIEYLNKIVTDHPGTIISRWSVEYLKLLKNK